LTSAKRLTHFLRYAVTAAVIVTGGFALTGCQNVFDGIDNKANVPIPSKLIRKMKAKGMSSASPIMLRIFKQENELEVWKRTHTGRYAKLKSYEICKWSGKLGPKFKEGDKQAPEGFYSVNKHQMNPNSSYHLSFNMGFPNRYDRAHGRTGAHLMVHGACSSAGCYSMTDEYVEEIYALAREAFSGGQKAFQIQAYPFRMTPKNMVKHRGNKHFEFWKMIKQGHDHFEITKVPPKVDVCDRRYVFNTIGKGSYTATAGCPRMEMPQTLAASFLKKQKTYALSFEKLLPSTERSNIATLAPVTLDSVLPGVTVAGPKSVVADEIEATAKPKTAAPTGAPTEAKKPETKPVALKPLTTGSVKESLSGDG